MITIEENWNRLKAFWDNITFEEAKKFDTQRRIEIEDTLEYTSEDIQRLNLWVSATREFSPASDEEIDKIEKELDVVLPNSFKESLKINAKDPIVENYEYPFLGSWNRFLEIDLMIEASKDNREILDFEAFEERNNLSEEYAYWGREWVIFFEWNMNYYGVLNLDKESSNYGEVLCLCVEDGSISRWANSYEEWFELVVEETLTYGELRISTIESLLSMNG